MAEILIDNSVAGDGKHELPASLSCGHCRAALFAHRDSAPFVWCIVCQRPKCLACQPEPCDPWEAKAQRAMVWERAWAGYAVRAVTWTGEPEDPARWMQFMRGMRAEAP